MRIDSSVTSISWIPSEAVRGMMKAPFEMGMAHYDEPPPDRIGTDPSDLEALRDADRFRFANRLQAWVEVDDGRICDYGYGADSGGLIGSTTVKLGGKGMTFQAVAYDDLQAEPEVGDGWVRFRQTAGGRTGVPAPRRVNKKPFVQFRAPTAWSTLALTVHADGRSDHEVVGASPFPRHWVYDHAGELAAKTGLVDFTSWYREAFGLNTPWGDEDSPAVVSALETALERELSVHLMRGGAKPRIRNVKAGRALVEQGAEGDELFLLLDGVLEIEHDGEPLAQFGPGAILGERAVVEGGLRTSTMRALTNCKVAVAASHQVDHDVLVELSRDRRREEARPEESVTGP